MIRILGNVFDSAELKQSFSPDSIERKVLEIMDSSSSTYSFNSVEQLKFELSLRKSTVRASVDLYRSGLSFRVFRESKCNEKYWERTEDGGFLLREGVSPAEAIEDIFARGSRYGTECATAMVIVFYKAVLDVFGRNLFDKVFTRINLMDWQHLDPKMGVDYHRAPMDFLPGDCRYFKNPDVDPVTPEWQGENAIDLSNDKYYGHGMGIRTAEGIIEALNRHRKEGSETSAYPLTSVTRLGFKTLYTLYQSAGPSSAEETAPSPVTASRSGTGGGSPHYMQW